MCPNLSHTSIIVIKLTSIKLRITKNRLFGYIVTFIHSDKHLWDSVMNYATLYSLEGYCWLLTYISVKIGLTHP